VLDGDVVFVLSITCLLAGTGLLAFFCSLFGVRTTVGHCLMSVPVPYLDLLSCLRSAHIVRCYAAILWPVLCIYLSICLSPASNSETKFPMVGVTDVPVSNYEGQTSMLRCVKNCKTMGDFTF